MKRNEYWRKPKKALGKNCRAWWYANRTNIEVHAEHADGGGHCIVVLTRRQLALYLEQSSGDTSV